MVGCGPLLGHGVVLIQSWLVGSPPSSAKGILKYIHKLKENVHFDRMQQTPGT